MVRLLHAKTPECQTRILLAEADPFADSQRHVKALQYLAWVTPFYRDLEPPQANAFPPRGTTLPGPAPRKPSGIPAVPPACSTTA